MVSIRVARGGRWSVDLLREPRNEGLSESEGEDELGADDAARWEKEAVSAEVEFEKPALLTGPWG